MKSIYDIILDKLNYDLKRMKREINEIIDEVEINSMARDRYNRLLGESRYCEDLIDFFYEASIYADD